MNSTYIADDQFMDARLSICKWSNPHNYTFKSGQKYHVSLDQNNIEVKFDLHDYIPQWFGGPNPKADTLIDYYDYCAEMTALEAEEAEKNKVEDENDLFEHEEYFDESDDQYSEDPDDTYYEDFDYYY